MENKFEICRACGAQIEINNATSCMECEYCGSIFYLAEKDENARTKEKASELFKACDFDGAKTLYQSIVLTKDDAEAYWFITLCKYGIQFVDDAKTGKKIPTCHRTLYAPILKDEDYLCAIRNSSAEVKLFYEEMAQKIDSLQKNIISVVESEKPYDVFICYKETGKDGSSTEESKVARDLFYKLSMEGYRVFYAPETLRDKAGYEFEPYIYSALSSSKVMFVIGFEKDNYNAVWVKNEWSRFLLRKATNNFLQIACCYRSIVATEDIIPEELANAHIIDLVNFSTNDLVEKAKTWCPIKKASDNVVVVARRGNPEALNKRGYILIKDRKFEDAISCFNKCLDIDTAYGEAYWGLILAKSKCSTDEELLSVGACISESLEYSQAVEYATEERKEIFIKIANTIDDKINSYLKAPRISRDTEIGAKLIEKKKIEKQINDFINETKKILDRIKEIEAELKSNIVEVREKLSELNVTMVQCENSYYEKKSKLEEKSHSWLRYLALDRAYSKVSSQLEKSYNEAEATKNSGPNALQIKRLLIERDNGVSQIRTANQELWRLRGELTAVCNAVKEIDMAYKTLEKNAKRGIFKN